MFQNNQRHELRQVFFDVWQKHLANQPLEPLEEIIAGIIREHPEYHQTLENPGVSLDRDYHPESGQSNPFLHMAMHIALKEQLSTQRPSGIIDIYQALTTRSKNAHEAEHQIMECLAEMLWQAQRAGTAPDEKTYLESLNKLLQK